MGSSCRAATPQFSSSTQFTVGITGFVSFGFALHAACIRSTGTAMVKELLAAKDWTCNTSHSSNKQD
jgi:hypothetical protein